MGESDKREGYENCHQLYLKSEKAAMRLTSPVTTSESALQCYGK